MSDAANFPPSNPINKTNQFQLGFFQGVQTAQVDTAANLAASNIVLLKGQIGYETDTKFFKLGDGTTAYNSLSYQPQFGKLAPLPQSGAGVGEPVVVMGASGAAINAPAGGLWWMILAYYQVVATGLMQGAYPPGSYTFFYTGGS